jgi:hypothetical protein
MPRARRAQAEPQRGEPGPGFFPPRSAHRLHVLVGSDCDDGGQSCLATVQGFALEERPGAFSAPTGA